MVKYYKYCIGSRWRQLNSSSPMEIMKKNQFSSFRKCIGEESNPGLPRDRREFYHWTTNAGLLRKSYRIDTTSVLRFMFKTKYYGMALWLDSRTPLSRHRKGPAIYVEITGRRDNRVSHKQKLYESLCDVSYVWILFIMILMYLEYEKYVSR